MEPIVVLGLWVIGFGGAAAAIAVRRARSPVQWAAIGAVLGPIALALLLTGPPGRCPNCDAPVRGRADVCYWCGMEFASAGPSATDGAAPIRPADHARPAGDQAEAGIRVAARSIAAPADRPVAAPGPARPIPARAEQRVRPAPAPRVVPAPTVADVRRPEPGFRFERDRLGRRRLRASAARVPQLAPERADASAAVETEPAAPPEREGPPPASPPPASPPPVAPPEDAAPADEARRAAAPAPEPPSAGPPTPRVSLRSLASAASAPAEEVPALAPPPPEPLPEPKLTPTPRPRSSRAEPRRSVLASLQILATAVYMTGSAGLLVGARYGIAIEDGRLVILGPVDKDPTEVALERPLSRVDATGINGRLIIGDSEGSLDYALVFISLAGGDADSVADSILAHVPGRDAD